MMFNFRFCSESNEAHLKETFEAVLKKQNLKYEIDWVLSGLPYLTEKKYFRIYGTQVFIIKEMFIRHLFIYFLTQLLFFS